MASEERCERYTYQAFGGSSGLSDYNFRITDTIGDNRIATCYVEDNAKLVTAMLNEAERGRIDNDKMRKALVALFQWQADKVNEILPDDVAGLVKDALGMNAIEAILFETN